jgi:hypothetical protein
MQNCNAAVINGTGGLFPPLRNLLREPGISPIGTSIVLVDVKAKRVHTGRTNGVRFSCLSGHRARRQRDHKLALGW